MAVGPTIDRLPAECGLGGLRARTVGKVDEVKAAKSSRVFMLIHNTAVRGSKTVECSPQAVFSGGP